MSLRDDRRAQSIQIGAVLLFGVLIILLATYQAFVVPDQNREVEGNHVATITQQMQELRNAIVSLPGAGGGQSITLTLGVEYPSRVIALNPPSPTGTVRTLGTTDGGVNTTVANAVATDGEVDDYWTGTNRSVNSGGIAYRPGYHEYQNPPTIVYENSLLYHQFDSGNLTRAGQRLIDGRRISLVAVNGSQTRAASGSVAMDLQDVSSSSRQISVTNEPGQNVTLDIATRFNRSQWESELAETGDYDDPDGYVAKVTQSEIPNSEFDVVHLHLERDVTYELQMAKVGMGTGVATEDEAYLTEVGEGDNSVQQGQNTTLVVEARDKLNNPVSGVSINASASAGTIESSGITDESGRAEFEFQAPGGLAGAVRTNFSYSVVPGDDFESGGAENLSAIVTVEGSGGIVSGELRYTGTALARDGPDSGNTPGGVEITYENTHSSTATITNIQIKPQDGSIDTLWDNVDGSGLRRNELFIDGDQSDGFVDWEDDWQTNWPDFNPPGTDLPFRANLDLDGVSRNGNPRLSSGGTGTVYLYEFYTEPTSDANVNMDGESIEVVVSYRLSNGRTFQVQDTVTPTTEGGNGNGGGEPGFSSVSAENVGSGGNNVDQTVTFTLDQNLPDGETVEIDLSDAQGSFDPSGSPRVDYESASPSVSSGSGSVQFTSQDADAGEAVLTYTGEGGGDDDGSTVEIEITGIETGNTGGGGGGGSYDVIYTRSDGGSSSTTFALN